MSVPMSVRLPLLAIAALTLAGCNFSKAPEEQAAACDCGPAAGKAAEVAASSSRAEASKASTTTVTRVAHRARPARRDRETRRYYASERSSERLYGAPYGRRYAGVSVSVEETETSSERYRYSESEERYGSAYGSAYGSSSSSAGGYVEGYGRDDRYGARTGGPVRHRGYTLAGTTRDGYLTWPGKVED